MTRSTFACLEKYYLEHIFPRGSNAVTVESKNSGETTTMTMPMPTTKRDRNDVATLADPTRRQAIVTAAIACTGLALVPTKAWAEADGEISHTEESIHQEVDFKANQKRIYEALTDTKQFDKVVQLSGAMQSMRLGSAPTEISREVGGAFTLFGGHITGRHVELVPNQRIVQAWRAGNFPPGVYSIARFELVEQGSGTRIVFDHTGFPKGDAETLASGWKAHYWEPLAKLLA
jgi:activator of HSP90 ATPase